MRAAGRDRTRCSATALILWWLLAACTLGAERGPATEDVRPVIEPGRGDFVFDGYAPLHDRPVRVYYDAPQDPATAEILVVMHGVGRNGEEYRADWESIVADRNVLVLVPEFAEDDYPGSAAYNSGNIVDDKGERLPPEQWSFHVIEALFDDVLTQLGSQETDYTLFGHSAGAQFVHRFVEFMPEHRARVAVAANAGWYTVLDDSVEFPYGLDGSPTQESGLERAFASNLVVLLGGDDVDPENDSLRRDDRSDAQGLNRLDRGLNFYRTARDVATAESLPFNWRLSVVPGIAHDHAAMAEAAAPMLFGTR